MTVAITGANGLIGSALAGALRADGVRVVRMVRRPASSPDEVSWDPARRWVDVDALAAAGPSAVVHLAGAGVGDHRWTASYKDEIRASRVDGTAAIAGAVAALPGPVFVHCHHGMHRGPAAAAVCAMSKEGWDRRQALAWLGHPVPADVQTRDEIWQWARQNWQLGRVPAGPIVLA